ncbi:hypothetical protein O2V63_10685 [Modestobacter sp. VKM Ac-2977]|uniref:hypothetical protein n=1 Tax=Modestobacter sp. VKM Ac-2977 TaxID=3004131 RepID=UPI0022AB06BC|nr:hypothetical protein [Modestobacter sp. VKM Ac-2977]MCZ2820794.1 hypothetical protein [Modestobacter sp. VKM Ac-2977]
MLSLAGVALYLTLVAAFFFLLYSVVNRAVLNALRTHHEETTRSAQPATPGPDHHD